MAPPAKPDRARKEPAAPKRPHGLPHGRWLGDIDDLTKPEEALIACCARGEPWMPPGWDWENPDRPEAQSPANTIRGEVIRFLALGGDALYPVHENGVMVWGGWIAGTLDLHQCQAPVRLVLQHCHFAAAPVFMNAKLPELALSGSRVPGLEADRITVTGGFFMRDGFRAEGEVRLPGGAIGGDLNCTGGTFVRPKGNALIADEIEVNGHLFLYDGFRAEGEVRLAGAAIGGNLDCTLGTFVHTKGNALNADRIEVTGSLFLRGAEVKSAIQLPAAKVATLIDQNFDWSAGGHNLDGFGYDRIIGPCDGPTRIAWLKHQRADFLDARGWQPQPWEQAIKVLREMGHPHAAAEVAMEKQRMMRAAGQFDGPLRRGLHWLYGFMAGYGYRPSLIVWRMVGVWLACAFFFQIGGSYGYLGPTTPLLSNSAVAGKNFDACGHRFEPGTVPWTQCREVPGEYTTFQPLIYSLDLILPLVDLQQESDWAPIVEDPPGRNLPYGVFIRWLMWLEILFGWVSSLMFVAIISRLVERD